MIRSPRPKRASASRTRGGRARTSEAPRVRLDVDERRARLLELGLDLFGRRSYESISIDDIAAEAGISKGLLYHYFGSKRGFYVATVRQAAADLVAHVAPSSSLPPAARVAAGLDAYLTFVEAHAVAYVALMRSGLGADPEVLEIVEGTRSAIAARILEEGLGLVAPPAIYRLALRSWIGAVEAASLEWIERRDLSKALLIRLFSELLVKTVTTAIDIEGKPPSRPVRR